MAGTGSSRKDGCISDLPYPIEYFDFTYGRHMTYDPAIPTTRRCHCRTNYSYPNKVVHQIAQERDQLLRKLSTDRLTARAAPPRGPGGVKRPAIGQAGPPEKKMSLNKCTFCGKPNHMEADCWRRTGRCLRCGSIDHQFRHCFWKNARQVSEAVKHGTVGPAGKAKVPEGIYILDRSAIVQDKNTMTGTFYIRPSS